MSHAGHVSARLILIGTLAALTAGPAPRAEARGELRARIGAWAKRGKVLLQRKGHQVITSLERAGFKPAQRFARHKRVAAFDTMLDRTWAQTVVRQAAKRGEGLVHKGLAGSVTVKGNKVTKTVEPVMDLRAEFGWKVGRREMQKLVDQEVSMQREAGRLVPGFTPRVFSYDRKRLSFSMELVPGKHLNEVTKSDLNPGALGRLRSNVSRLHRAGLAHGDIKPANIMVVGGEMKLIDWGTARRGVGKGGTETVMDHFLRRSMGHPGPVNLKAFDRRAMRRVYQAVAKLPE